MTNEPSRAQNTAELVDALYTFMPTVVHHVNERLQDAGLTNTEYWALRSINQPTPMKRVAECMSYDPSYVTVVADRLEELGYIERTPDPNDRRIKNLTLTETGRKVRERVIEPLWAAPSPFSSLTDEELDDLMALVAKIGAPEAVASP